MKTNNSTLRKGLLALVRDAGSRLQEEAGIVTFKALDEGGGVGPNLINSKKPERKHVSRGGSFELV